MFSRLPLQLALASGLGLAALAATMTGARAADVHVDVYRVPPPRYHAPPSRVVVVAPSHHCYWRTQRVWVAGALVTRRVRRCV